MSIKIHIMNHEIKLMEIGGREEISLKGETTISIVLELSLASISSSPIYPSLEWTR
jgi:hypothetical protein